MNHSNLHIHTTHSDGESTPMKLALLAKEKNMTSLGFSDHSEIIFGLGEFSMNEKCRAYLRDVKEVKEKMEDIIPVFCGIELDYYSKIPTDDFEYCIGSVHFIQTFDGTYYPLDHSAEQLWDFLEKEAKGEKLELAKRYFDLLVDHAEKNPIEIVGHFDLINKFGYFDSPDEAYQKVALEALDEVLNLVPYIEVNTGAIARGYRTEPYPDDFLLKRILERKGRLVINGDTHFAEHLLCHYNESVEKLKKMGFESIWQKGNAGYAPVQL